MKQLKKLASVFLVVAMMLAMTIPALAGSITIKPNDSGIDVTQKQFAAYKILDATVAATGVGEDGKGIAYTVPSNNNLRNFYKKYFNLSTNIDVEPQFSQAVVDEIAKLNTTEKLQEFAKAVLTEQVVTAVGNGSVVGDDYTIKDLKPGYYLVQDTSATSSIPISALALNSVTGSDLVINIKASQPTIDKQIEETDNEGNKNLTDHNNVSIGDTVNYVATSSVPDMTGYKKYYFIVTDTLSKGLTFNNDVVIMVGNDTLASKTEGSDDYDYEVKVTQNPDNKTTKVEIIFHEFVNRRKDDVGEEITIKYSATVNGDAEVGTKPNKNSVYLKYSNNPVTQGDGEGGDIPGDDDPVGVTPEAETFTYVTGLKIFKVDGDSKLGTNIPLPLKGAEFKIEGTRLNQILIRKSEFVVDATGDYYKLKNGTYTTTSPTSENSDKYEDTTTHYKLKISYDRQTTTNHVSETMTTGDDGILHFNGLGAGTYTITEIKAPDGYNKLDGSLSVVIDVKYGSEAVDYKPEWTATVNGASNVSVVDGIISFNVENKTGTLLPSTGGAGTTLIYILGGVLIVGAGAVLVLKKKKEEQ